LIDAINLFRREQLAAAELERVMNPIEKVMVKRSQHVKLALAVVALVLVLWGTGTPILSLWLTPVIIFVLWVGIQLGLGYRRRHA
jgi:O-antigen ligase